MEQMETQREELIRELASTTGLSEPSIRSALMAELPPEEKMGVIATLTRLMRDDFQRRRAARALVREWKQRGGAARLSAGGRSAVRSVLAIARRQIALTQQIRVLESTHRVFAYWHAAHRPVAVTAFLAVAIHVTVAVVMGATWFR